MIENNKKRTKIKGKHENHKQIKKIPNSEVFWDLECKFKWNSWAFDAGTKSCVRWSHWADKMTSWQSYVSSVRITMVNIWGH